MGLIPWPRAMLIARVILVLWGIDMFGWWAQGAPYVDPMFALIAMGGLMALTDLSDREAEPESESRWENEDDWR